MTDVNVTLCYDGSAPAKEAIERLAALHPDASVTILTAWQPMEAFLLSRIATLGATQQIDRDIERAARERAAHGVRAARAAGLIATEATTRAGSSIGRSLVEWCDTERPDLVVVGATGDSAWSDVVTGSVATHVIHHSSIPVLIVHDPVRTAARRPMERERAHAG